MTPTPTPTPFPVVREDNLSCIPPEPVITPGEARLVPAYADLPNRPSILSMVEVPGRDTWLVAERAGRVSITSTDPASSSWTTVLDIRAQVETNFEMGLTGIALHPNFPTDNRVFAIYNDSRNGRRSNLSSFRIDRDSLQIDIETERPLLNLHQPRNNHNGGDIAFGLDGMLYLSFGDGGDDRSESQDLSNLYGAILRLDVDAADYRIPTDNPFNEGQSRCTTLDNSRSQICPEIFAYGFRNPWRFSVDSLRGDVWVGDVGEGSREEVDRLVAGGNYGWPIMEGTRCVNSGCDRSGLEMPVSEYTHSDGQAIVGGYVYRGSRAPDLVGKYIFGDIYSQTFWTVDADAPPGTTPRVLMSPAGLSVVEIAEALDGELYFLNLSSETTGEVIYALTSDGSSSVAMPERLSETGCFNVADKSYPQGVFAYDINAPLWSDGAAKGRAFAIPDDTEISVLGDGDFDFPVESVLIKHFLADSTYLETRLFIHFSTGWRGFSYEWNDSQTEATLLSDGKTKDVGPFVHTYPSRGDCITCHTASANFSLGLELAQLNRDDAMRDANFVDYLSEAGYLAAPHASASAPRLADYRDAGESLDARARAYLHSNCAGCHRPGGTADFMDLRYATLFENTGTCDVDPQAGDLGVPNAKRIAPGNPDASVLLLRMASEEANERMPPLASRIADPDGTALIREWIAGIGGCE